MKTLILLLLITSCTKEAMHRDETDNTEFKIDTLFTHNGCTIYRFRDSRDVYFSSCGATFRQSYTKSCGNNCTKTVRQTTLGLE